MRWQNRGASPKEAMMSEDAQIQRMELPRLAKPAYASLAHRSRTNIRKGYRW